ncbi:MAG TPA: hypothetical protein VJN01_05635, partial [Xanthomonadales bacterium]|nr:hypothetical protein [Xanthomonadales bacterium]
MAIRKRLSNPLLSGVLLVLLLSLSPVASLLAENRPNWDRATALQAADAEQGQQQVRLWLQQIDSGQAVAVLGALQQSTATGA